MYACVCNGISARQLASCWAETHPDVERLVKRLGLHGENNCGRCVEELDSLVDAAECALLSSGAAG